MTTLFTEHELIRYIYGETTEPEKTEIENALILDPELGAEVFRMKTNLGLLDQVSFNPSEGALQNILSYSYGYAGEQA